MEILLLQDQPFDIGQKILETLAQQAGLFIAQLPRILGALLLIIIGRWISKFFGRAVRKLLQKIGVDKLAERLDSVDLISGSNIKVVPSAVMGKVVYYLSFFIFILIATDVLGMKAITDMMNSILNYTPNLFSALLVFVIGLLLADFIKKIVLTTCNSIGIPAAGLISNVVFYFLFLNVAMITLSQAKVETAFIEENLSIILGGVVLAFAIGYGFASRPVLSNLLAAYYKKGKVDIGDQIIIDGVNGEIIEMDNTSFTVMNDGGETIIPLFKLTTEKYQLVRKDPPQEEPQQAQNEDD